MKNFVTSLVLLVLTSVASYAQGPGPLPSPWGLNGPTLYYNNGGVTLGNPVGGSCGIGCINVSGGLRINGVPITPTGGISPPSTTALGGVYASSAPSNQFVRGISTSGLPIFAQPSFSNLSGQAILSQLPNMTAQSVLCNATGGSNAPTACTILPTGLSIPNPTMTGTANAAALTTSGVATLNSVSIPGGGSVGGTLTANNLTVFGTLTPGTFAPTNLSTGNGTFTGTVTTNNLTVTGTSTFSGTFSPNALAVSNNGTFGGTLGVTGLSTLSSLSVTGNGTVGGTLGVTGVSSLAGQVKGGFASTNDYLATYAYFGGGTGNVLVESDTGLTPIVAAARTKNNANATGGYTAGDVSWFFQDGVQSNPQQGAASYREARRYPTTTGPALVQESEITEFGTSVSLNPYISPALGSLSVAHWIGSGGGCNGTTYICYNPITGLTNLTATDASGFMMFFSNAAKARTGITFSATALTGNDGAGAGSAPAILFPNGDYIGWYSPDGTLHTQIYGANSNSGAKHRLAFVDTGMYYQNFSSATLFDVDTSGNGFFGGTLAVTGKTTLAASVTGAASLNIPQGTAPAAPANGDVWMTSAGLFYRFNGTTHGPL